MRATAIIQARMGSSRFPGKVLQPIWNDLTSIDFIIRRLYALNEEGAIKLNVIVATTTRDIDNDLVKYIEKMYDGIIKIYRGSEDDVFDRITHAASVNCPGKESVIVEITADCPLICPLQIESALLLFKMYKLDYFSNAIIRNFPVGFDWQIYKQWMLTFMNDKIPNPAHRVHGGWNIANYSWKFYETYPDMKFRNLYADEMSFHPDWRVTLDYPEDLLLIRAITEHFKHIYFTQQDVIKLLIEKPELLDINKSCRQKIAGTDKVV